MPPKRTEDQHRIDVASGSHPTDEESDEDISGVVPGIQEDRVDTRAGHNDKLRKLVQEIGKLPLTFRKCDGRPVGTYAKMFTTELGLVVKTFAPLQVEEWRNVTEEQKKPMFDRLQNFFVVDFSTGPDSVRKETDVWMGGRYRDNRSKLRKHYKEISRLPWELRLENAPKNFYGDESDWAYLCTLFESEKFKSKSEQNALNRAQLQTNHCGGSKSFVRHSYETGDGPQRVNRIELYKRTHWNEKNGWVAGAEEIYEKMVQRFNELKEAFTCSGLTDDSEPLDDIEISVIVCDEILGMRSGYIPGLGHGPKPSKLISGDNRSTNAKLSQELKSTQEELKSTQDELESTRTSLQSAQADIKSLKENMENMEAHQRLTMLLFQKIAPNEYQSLIGQMSSSTPSL